MSWTQAQARALADRILSMSKAPACEVSLSLRTIGHTRFAANDVTTAGVSENLSITITSIDGGRAGTITTDTTRSGTYSACATPSPARSEGPPCATAGEPNPECAVDPLPAARIHVCRRVTTQRLPTPARTYAAEGTVQSRT